MKYKVLAFDLDGTLTNTEKKVTERTREAICAAQQEGCTVVLASGRPVYGIMPVAKELNLQQKGGYILAYNGACIVDCMTNEIIYDKKIPNEYVTPICKFAIERDYALLTYEGDCVITNKKENKYVQIEAGINHLPVKQIEDIDAYIHFPVNKFIITEDPATVEKELPVVRASFPALNAFTSAPFFLEIVPPDIDKSYTLKYLLSILGYTAGQLAAFGDGENDAIMLKEAGMGVAMANAVDTVKTSADYVTLSNDEDGCGIAIEKMLAGEL
ncbi:MAG: Cof-type HAD-IIB family hydrolase [Alistipes sp.]|nr:Cof-type HAD-IIB family hydrolase [Alistipes sp.]